MNRAILWVVGGRFSHNNPGCIVISNYVTDREPLPTEPLSFTSWLKAGWRIAPGGTPSTTENATTIIVLEHD